jgi:hypothetical protein
MAYLSFKEMLAQADTEASVLFKWALIGPEFRFVEVDLYESHLELVNEGETATAAGAITVSRNTYKRYSQGSLYLRVGCAAEHEARLFELLEAAGREFRYY